jgi:hypothetical protein
MEGGEMKRRKIYRVVASRYGCFGGAGGTERVYENITNQRKAVSLRNKLVKKNKDKRTIYFAEWDWA